jgi:hypothetical protein
MKISPVKSARRGIVAPIADPEGTRSVCMVLSRDPTWRSGQRLRSVRWQDLALHRHLAPPTNGKAPSTQSRWHRIRYHYRGNVESSTVRLTSGYLLSRQLGIEMRRVGSGKRMTFAAGEHVLSEWMAQNAFVMFQEYERPRELEGQLVRTASWPLNLDQNRNHQVHSTLTELCKTAKQLARTLDISP